MAAPTARSSTRTIAVLVDLSPGRRASTVQGVETSLSAVTHVERSMTWEFGTGYSGRLSLFAYFAGHRDGSTRQASSLHESARPTKTPRIGRLRKG